MFGSSQSLGLGAGSQGVFASQTQSQSPEKRVRQEDKQTCMPTTVRVLLDAHREVAEKGAELQLHGAEVANVTLVGVVEGLVRQATMLEFTLNDASGRVKVRQFQSTAMDSEKDGIVAGQYASVVGSLRASPVVHVSAMSLRPVTGADEVSYHMIEVAHAALLMKRGGSKAPTISAPNVMSQPTVAPVSQPPAAAAVPAAVAAAAPAGDVRSSVLEVLRTEGESRQEGVPKAVVLERLKSSPAGGVTEALQQLVADGEAFNTIDDNHFQLV